MTSGTVAGSNALPHKTASPAEKSPDNLPVRSPTPPRKHTASPRSLVPVSANDKRDSASHASSDGEPVNGVNGHNESEAETEILSGSEQDKTKGKRRLIKTEDGADTGRTTHLTSPRHSRKHSHAVDLANGASERKSADRNGHKRMSIGSRPEDGAKSKSGSPSYRSQSKATTDSGEGRRKSPSIEDAPSPTVASSDRGRAPSISGSRKRKIREEHHLRNLEPPQQRLKSDPSIKSPATHNLRAQPTSPSQTTPGLRSHKRSQSTQSVLASANNRKRRELSSAHDRKQWRSDTSSNASSSPQPTTPAVFQHPSTRTKRSSHRSVTSPGRSGAPVVHPKKNVDKFGATRLAREGEKGNIDAVKLAYELAPEELNQEDFAGFAPLQKAALNGHADVVEFLLKKGCRTD